MVDQWLKAADSGSIPDAGRREQGEGCERYPSLTSPPELGRPENPAPNQRVIVEPSGVVVALSKLTAENNNLAMAA